MLGWSALPAKVSAADSGSTPRGGLAKPGRSVEATGVASGGGPPAPGGALREALGGRSSRSTRPPQLLACERCGAPRLVCRLACMQGKGMVERATEKAGEMLQVKATAGSTHLVPGSTQAMHA